MKCVHAYLCFGSLDVYQDVYHLSRFVVSVGVGCLCFCQRLLFLGVLC